MQNFQQVKLIRLSWLVVQLVFQLFKKLSKLSLAKSHTRASTQTNALLLVLQFKQACLVEKSKMCSFLMLHHFLLVLKLWEECLLNLLKETQQFLQRNHKSSQPLLTINQALIFMFFKASENLPLRTKLLEDSNLPTFLLHQEGFLKSKLPLILMQMAL